MFKNPENLNIEIQQRLVEELTKTNRELKLINNFSTTIQNSKSTDDVINSIRDYFTFNFGEGNCTIYLIQESCKYLVPCAPTRLDNEVSNHEIDSPIIYVGKGLIGRVAETTVAEIINGPTKHTKKSDKNLPLWSKVAVPMLDNENVIFGVIYSKHHGNLIFEKNNMETLNIIASMATTKMIQIKNLEKIADYQVQLEEYVHIVSHDLKSPLRSINALMHWIKEDNDGKLNESTLKNLNNIDSILVQMENLITGTLNYSKTGQKSQDENQVDLNLVIQKIQKNLYCPQHIAFSIENTLPTVFGDEVKFIQIFQNLIENSIKYNDKTNGSISISSEECEKFYKFSVKDNGVGINEKYFDKIFQVFQSLSENKSSSGIGLSIVKKLVHQYKGKIWVESSEGIGTTFHFTIRK